MATNKKLTQDEELEKNKLNGVDDATVNKAYNSTFNASTEQQIAQTNSNDALSRVEDLTSKNTIVGADLWHTLNSTFQKPTAVTEADSYLKTQLSKIQSGKTSYSDQVKDMMAQIQGRDKFSYDVDNDPLFQQALSSAMSSGKQAMQDTIGQASALTGGYGSTYATTAGNQAYNSFIEDAYDNLPQYYQMAMEAYQMEGDELYRQLGMLTDADDREYNRNLTAYDTTFNYRNRMYDESYQLFRDSKTDAYNIANLKLSEHGQLVSDAYNYYNASSDYANTLYNREYGSWADQVSQAQQMAQMLNSDYWSQANFDEGVRQFDENYKQTEKWNQKDLDYKNASLAEEKRQYNISMGDTNNDGVVSDEEYAKYAERYGSKSEAEQYDGYINPDDVEVDENGNILNIKGYNIAGANGTEKPTVSKFRTAKGDNFEITIGDKTYKVENKGKRTEQSTINKIKKEGIAYGDIWICNGNAYLKYGKDFYKIGGQAFKESGYNDLLLALQK